MNMPGLSAEASLYKSSEQYFLGTGWASLGDSHLGMSQLDLPKPLPNGGNGGPICKPIRGPCNIPASPADNCPCVLMRNGGTTCEPETVCCTASELTTTTPCSKNPTTGVCERTTTNRCTSPPVVTRTPCTPTCGSCVGGSCGCDNYPTCARTPGTITCTDACGDTTTKSC